MSDEKPQTETVAVVEEKAPELPTTEPPKDDAPAAEVAAIVEAPVVAADGEAETKPEDAEAKPEEAKAEKKTSTLKKRLTFKFGKQRDQIEAPKEPEAPADPRENALAWIGQQIPAAVHKVNFHVLDWAQQLAVEDESARQPLPGKDAQVTRNQFLAFLRDGDLLTKLANKLQAGAVDTAVPEEGADAAKQKEVQTKNVEAFAAWAKTNLGTEDDKAMTAADLLEKGKAGYPAVFETLWGLGLKAQEKFQQNGIDVDTIVAAAGAAVRTNLIGQILSFFRRNRRASVEKKEEDKPAEEADAAAANAPEGEQVEEACQKVDSAAASSTPAVAAN